MKKEFDKMVDAYLKNPGKCPWCNSVRLVPDNIDFGLNTCWRRIKCNYCGKIWDEIFELKEIVEWEVDNGDGKDGRK